MNRRDRATVRRRSDELRLRMIRWLHVNGKNYRWCAQALGIGTSATSDWFGHGVLPPEYHDRAEEIINGS